ncbi:helix-turn-helix transcriptional regulator [Ramlibacter sp. AW1]|uniref:Helix-turn-helix transcriptional regulator n=1 Tax=Ramlibacter aurantiacus TaxID=2801330 RepID=A0A936ZT87_9BURK|nr:XrtB/PEP-CTERM-associated transcriptional regulator EpsA [Ramlibacter aurantiacus]MBL0420194.1 helix-turn-helix transcriptional regulator [Ramlibacter aurantiacus]
MSAATCTDLATDPAAFLHVATRGAALATHADLWRWLRDDVQCLLPHELLLVAWGDFDKGEVQVDLVSSLPGLRTHECRTPRLMPLLNYLRDCWTAAQHSACQVEVHGGGELFIGSGHDSAAGQALASMRSAVVHGTRDARTGCERIFAALSSQSQAGEGAPATLRLLMPFIDLSLRAMSTPALRPNRLERGEIDHLVGPLGTLSERERQIMVWVAMGKTNPEIGCILRISEFTVKNHMKSIFTKLDVTNRAQAVAKLTRMATYA